MDMILPTHKSTLPVPDCVDEINKFDIPTKSQQKFLSDTRIQTIKGLSVVKSQKISLVMEILKHVAVGIQR